MTNENTMVGTTADSLVVIRSGQQAKAIGVEDPFAEWFLTEDGFTLLQVAKETDKVYEEYNLARYKFTTSRLRTLSSTYQQMLVLGSGFDCRPIWLNGFQQGETTVFELDSSTKLQQKHEQLRRHGVSLPAWLHSIPGSLANPNLPEVFIAAGLNRTQPVLVLAEGLFFFVPSEVVKTVLNPNWLGLTRGSRMIFDCWSDARVHGLNARLVDKIGHHLFHPFPYQTEPEILQHTLIDLGYRHVTVTLLSNLVEEYYKQVIVDDYTSSWLVVEATV